MRAASRLRAPPPKGAAPSPRSPTLGVASRGCGYDPVFATLAAIPSWSGLSAEALEAEPYAGLTRAETERAEAGLKADKTAFCDRVWAEYGAEGTRVRALVER